MQETLGRLRLRRLLRGTDRGGHARLTQAAPVAVTEVLMLRSWTHPPGARSGVVLCRSRKLEEVDDR